MTMDIVQRVLLLLLAGVSVTWAVMEFEGVWSATRNRFTYRHVRGKYIGPAGGWDEPMYVKAVPLHSRRRRDEDGY
jgi:hypothetical protein